MAPRRDIVANLPATFSFMCRLPACRPRFQLVIAYAKESLALLNIYFDEKKHPVLSLGAVEKDTSHTNSK